MKDKPKQEDRMAALREAARRVKAKPERGKDETQDKARRAAAERFGKR